MERLISLVAPHLCIVCGAEGSVLCEWCLPEAAPNLPQRCYRCRAQTDNSQVCQKCRRTSSIKHVWVRTSYDGTARQLVHDYKFVRKQAAGRPLASLMSESLPFLDKSTIIVHVPTVSSHVRRRGYDHAKILARHLAKDLGLSYYSLLARHGKSRQVGATRQQRLEQLRQSFSATNPAKIQGAKILLVDDIITTGGTVESAARCLRQAGAKWVDVAVFAQKE